MSLLPRLIYGHNYVRTVCKCSIPFASFTSVSQGRFQPTQTAINQPTISPCAIIDPWAAVQRTVFNHQLWRNKSKKSSSGRRDRAKPSSEVDEDDDDTTDPDHGSDAYEALVADKHSRIVKVTVSSMRADLLLKAGLGIARNKVETMFYDSKIRVNGRKLLKKSAPLEADDEIDVVRGPSPNNPEHLVVSRVEILSIVPQTENLHVTLRRQNSLVIENYPDQPNRGNADRDP
ncbi:mitochondrial transcription rescue factor 1 [Anopheles cruzii]|uniref:mitochondrial transcription rescue factor 1 n=1 Tax=Anopheles cruzii TaxID=68878 RepID=UPI0022EC911B|nr:mitochondrial transcription rescue factor 1 [Anopheles cruzii]XP_052861328.1 mitochondrial transcription rescue factor 1 [Anopheles cruzii]